jgi:hypothetical protein
MAQIIDRQVQTRAEAQLHSGDLDVASYGRLEKELLSKDKGGELRAHVKRNHPNEHLSMEQYVKKRGEGWDGR